MENYPDRISPMTLAAAMALGSGGGDTPSAKVYYPAGSVPFLGLPALSENKIGAVYDVTDEFTSTENFTDGGGKKYSAGTNVAIVNVGTEVNPVLKYDCMMGDLSEILGVIPSTATTSNKLATAADVTGEDISSTSTTSPITDSADGMMQEVTIYGRSEVVDGEIKSVGDDGLIVTTANSDNTLTTSVEFTTAIPLRSVSDTVRDTLTCTAESKQVETVCGRVVLADLTWTSFVAGGFAASLTDSPTGIIALICSKYPYDNSVTFYWSDFNTYDNKTLYRSTGQTIYIKDTDYTTVSDFVASLGGAELIYELATPTVTPLTDAEISAFRGLKTYDSTTNITITDEPDFELDYLKNTENGKAVADIQRELQEQIDDKITVSSLLTLTVAGWSSNAQTVTFAHDTAKRNVIDVDPASVEEWATCGVIATTETANNITFSCKSVPANALSFKVTSMGV